MSDPLAESPSESPRAHSPANSVVSTHSLGRSMGKRTIATDVLSGHHPLLATGSDLSTSPTAAGTYAVYSGKRKPAQLPVISPAAAGPPSPAFSNATTRLPPPTSPATHLPPLVSRPSDSSLPTALQGGRPYARSISEAKERLQGQNLKADLQTVGLSPESAGALFVGKISTLVGEKEWEPVLSAVASGRVTMLLPAEKLSSLASLTPALLLDHLILADTARSVASTSSLSTQPVRGFATLSGFRGVIDSDKLVVLSCGNPLSYSPTALLKTPASIFSPDLADLTLHKAIRGPTTSVVSLPHFPSFAIVSSPDELSIPRPATRPTKPSAPERTTSRLAALFAKPVDTIPNSSNGPLLPATDVASSRSPVPNLQVRIIVVEKIIRRGELIRSVGKATESCIRDELRDLDGGEGESSVLARVCSFANRFQPPSNWTSCFPPSALDRKSTSALSNKDDSLYTKDVEEVAEAMQNLFHSLRMDLARNLRAGTAKERKRERSSNGPEGFHVEKAEEELDSTQLDNRVDVSLERIEKVLTTVLFDRLFSPASSGDAQEDENLASRIAALNLLELSLEHLGLDLGQDGGSDGFDANGRTLRDSLEEIIGVAGKELARLQDVSTRSPKEKATIFVNLHKIIVEGLSLLPPIPMKEGKLEDAAGGKKQFGGEVEMDDASLRSSRPTSVKSSTTIPEEEEDDVLSTPRPTLDDETSIPSIALPDPSLAAEPMSQSSSSQYGELASSVHEATSSSVFDPAPSKTGPSSASSADLILPLLIFLVVQYNPPRLISNLLFLQRFRAESLVQSQASYCATNIEAVIAFCQSVDIAALGLDSSKVRPALDYSTSARDSVRAAVGRGTTKLIKGRVTNVTQELDRFVDSANSQLVNVVDSLSRFSFGAAKAKASLLRRTSSPGFRPASNSNGIIDSGSTEPAGGGTEKAQREMRDIVAAAGGEGETDATFNSYLETATKEERLSIADRLASISARSARFDSDVESSTSSPVISTIAPPPPLPPRRPTLTSLDAPSDSTAPAVNTTSTEPPLRRFLECDDAGELRLRDVAELLEDYKRLAALLSP